MNEVFYTQAHGRFFNIVIALSVLIGVCTGNGFAVEISAQPFPAGGIRVEREELSTSSIRLSIENLDISTPESNRLKSRTWMLAGARGKIPSYVIESVTFIQNDDGRETSRTEIVPDSLKQNLIRFSDLGIFRQYWTYSFNVTVASPGGDNRFWILDKLVLRIDLGEPTGSPEAGIAERWKEKVGEDTLAESLLINPNVDRAFYVQDYNDPVDTWKSWTSRVERASQSGDMYQFRIFEGGLYRIDASILDGTTSQGISTPPNQWRVFKDGLEVPVFSVPGIPGALFLPVKILPTDGMRYETFWVDTTGFEHETDKPLRLSEMPGPNLSRADGRISTVPISILNRELNEYVPSHNTSTKSDKWFWTEVTHRKPSYMDLKLPDYFNNPENDKVEITARYSFPNFPPIQPSLQLFINGREASETSLTLHQGDTTFFVEGHHLRAGKNEIALILSYPYGAESFRPVLIQSIRVNWIQQVPAPQNDLVYFSEPEANTTRTRFLSLPASLNSTDAIIGFQENISSLLKVNGQTLHLPGAPYSQILFVDCSRDARIPNVQKVQKTVGLDQFKSAKSVIIAGAGMVEGSLRLKTAQERRGLTSVVFPVEDLYSAFSYGNPSSSAIRNGLRYLFNRAQGDAPEYVTIVGEASDFRGNMAIVPDDTQIDMVPASTSQTPEAPQGDNLYSAAIGSDLVGDFIVGRIPASTPEELIDYLNKVDDFEKAPSGDWARIAEFVMDDNDEFPEVVSHILADSMAPQIQARELRQWDYEYVNNLRVQGVKRSWGATDRLLEVFNSGVGVLNFFGHGGPNLWSHERMLHLSDLDKIKNGSMLPLITCASCDSAWISYPTMPVKASMGEKLVIKPDGGAIGLFGPVAGASPYEHETLVKNLMEGLSRVQLRRTGDLTFYAKSQYYSITRSASIVDQYLLLGDPTVSLPVPVVNKGLLAKVVEVEGHKQVILRVNDVDVSKFSGTISLYSPNQKEPLRLAFGAGMSQWIMPLPEELNGSTVYAIVEGKIADKELMLGTAFKLDLPKGQTDKIPKVISVKQHSYEIKPEAGTGSFQAGNQILKYRIKSDAGVMSSVRVIASSNGEVIGEATRVDVGPGNDGTFFEIKIASERTDPSLSSVTLAVYPIQTEVASAMTTVSISYPGKSPADLEFVPGTVKVYSKSGSLLSGATVFIDAELKNNGKTDAKNLTLQALQDDPATGTELVTINGVNLMRVGDLAPGQSKPVSFRWEKSRTGSFSKVYLVVNRTKAVPETNFDNNSILVPDFKVEEAGNFILHSFDTAPRYATPGTSVTVNAVLQYEKPAHDLPVTFETGWNRPDGESTATKTSVRFSDGWATVSQELVVPEGFTHLFADINADHEIEESRTDDNSAKKDVVIASLAGLETATTWSLSHLVGLGVYYNLMSPIEGTLATQEQFTSVSNLLVVDKINVTTGTVSGRNLPDDNAWWVQEWRVAANPEEEAGLLALQMPIPGMSHDVPGELDGFVFKNDVDVPTIDFRKDENSDWQTLSGDRTLRDRGYIAFDELNMQNGSVSWQMKQSEPKTLFNLEYMMFRPRAVQWDSPVVMLPPNARNRQIQFTMESDNRNNWRKTYVDWRTGTLGEDGNIVWTDWETSKDEWQVSIQARDYLQMRMVGVPVRGEKAYLEKFGLSAQ